MRCRMFKSFPKLHPRDDNRTHSCVAIKNVPRHCQMSLGWEHGGGEPQLRPSFLMFLLPQWLCDGIYMTNSAIESLLKIHIYY